MFSSNSRQVLRECHKNRPLTLMVQSIDPTENIVQLKSLSQVYLLNVQSFHDIIFFRDDEPSISWFIQHFVGSAFGPPFPVMPLTAGTVFSLPEETGEANMFSFAASLLSLQLLQNNKNLVRRHRHVFQHLFLSYQTQLSYQRDNGGFAMFTHSDVPASVWWVILKSWHFFILLLSIPNLTYVKLRKSEIYFT